MLRAANRIEHGMPGKDGKNAVVIIEAGQPVKELPKEVQDALMAVGAIYDDRVPADPAA